MQDDKQLVEQFLALRSESAFKKLYQNQTPALYQLAVRLAGGNQELAAEQVQEMWVRVIQSLDKFEWRAKLKTWMTGILVNLFRDMWRSKHSKTEELPLDTDKKYHNGTEQKLTAIDLENALAKLPAGYREIVILHDVEGYKHKEIAEMLNINEGTSKSQLSRARAVLRKNLID